MEKVFGNYVCGVLLPVLLLASGLFYLCRMRWFYLIHPVRTMKKMLGGECCSGISPFRATTLALAGTLGVGNIVGVASAIVMGGAGAVFWMVAGAICAAVLKYAEIVLAVRHRRTGRDGQHYGGAMYYIFDIISGRGFRRCAVWLSVLFTLFCLLNSFTMGCIIQVNAISHALEGVWGVPLAVTGGILVLFCLFAVSRGVRAVSALTEKTVPAMTLIFFLLSLVVIFRRADVMGQVIASVFRSAFSSASGVPFFLSGAVRYGMMRGLLSNEAGCGTAPIAHAAADTESAVRQGTWGIFEVLVDTVLLCTVTALVILSDPTAITAYADNPMMLTIHAYASVLGNFAGWFLCIAVVLFGASTLVCWGHYGIQCLRPIAGGKRGKVRIAIYVVLYSVCAWIGSVSTPDAIWFLADLALAGMTCINLPILLLSVREVTRENPV